MESQVSPPDAPATGDLAQLLTRMLRIRTVETQIAERYSRGQMRCPTHLSIGQEAVAVGVAMALRETDLALSTHRCHAHYLAKGGDLHAMLAEIHGKVTGCSRGKGGSMHLIDRSVGFVGSTAIVGNTIPVGVGLALSLKLRKTDAVSCVFFGDAAVEEGAFYEAVNFAVLKQLPVLFVCENNGYSVYSPMRVRQPRGRSIASMVAALGLDATGGDGNDPAFVLGWAREAVVKIREGAGPQFAELATYRWREHCGPNYDNDLGYRSVEEFEQQKAFDPIARAERALRAAGALDDTHLREMQTVIDNEIAVAFERAEADPFPDPSEALTNIYAGDRA